MSEFYTIVCFTKSNASLEYEYTNSAYLLSRVPDLAKTLASAILKVHKGGDVYKQEYGVSHLPDGRAVVVDEKWGLTKKRLVTPGLMSRLNEAWPLLDMLNVHEITYPDGDGEPQTEYTNCPPIITLVNLIIGQLPSEGWTCTRIPVESEQHLENLRGKPEDNKWDRCKRGDFEIGDDDEEEGGDDGWCTKGLRLAYEPLARRVTTDYMNDDKAEEDTSAA